MYSKFENVYWIGGTSGAAKSTIAERIAACRDMVLYHTDVTIREHSTRCSAKECPLLEGFKNMSMDERWATRSPQEMYDTFQWFHGEGFRFIIEDLQEISRERTVLIEGFRLLPALVKPFIASARQAIWLISTPEFRLKAFTDRGSLWKIPNKTTQPERALKNHLEREKIFADRLSEETALCKLPALTVDGERSEEELLEYVIKHFGI